MNTRRFQYGADRHTSLSSGTVFRRPVERSSQFPGYGIPIRDGRRQEWNEHHFAWRWKDRNGPSQRCFARTNDSLRCKKTMKQRSIHATYHRGVRTAAHRSKLGSGIRPRLTRDPRQKPTSSSSVTKRVTASGNQFRLLPDWRHRRPGPQSRVRRGSTEWQPTVDVVKFP